MLLPKYFSIALGKAIDLRPDYVEARELLAQTYARDEQFDQAANEYKSILKYDANHKEAAVFLAKYYTDKRDSSEANKVLERYLANNPKDPQMRFTLARAQFDMNKLDLAKKNLDLSLAQEPNSSSAHSLYGKILIQKHDYARESGRAHG